MTKGHSRDILLLILLLAFSLAVMSWVLVRTRPRQWLLIKHRDPSASSLDITAEEPRSAVSRRTLASIARAAGASAKQLVQAEQADRSSVAPARPTD